MPHELTLSWSFAKRADTGEKGGFRQRYWSLWVAFTAMLGKCQGCCDTVCPFGANPDHLVHHGEWDSFMKENSVLNRTHMRKQPEGPNVLEIPRRRGLCFLLSLFPRVCLIFHSTFCGCWAQTAWKHTANSVATHLALKTELSLPYSELTERSTPVTTDKADSLLISWIHGAFF